MQYTATLDLPEPYPYSVLALLYCAYSVLALSIALRMSSQMYDSIHHRQPLQGCVVVQGCDASEYRPSHNVYDVSTN